MSPFLKAKEINNTINDEGINFCAIHGSLYSDFDSFFCGYYIKDTDIATAASFIDGDTFFVVMAVGKVKKHILNLPDNIKSIAYERAFKKNTRQIRKIDVQKLIKLLNH